MNHIPNVITCLNLLSGCMACVMALQFNPTGAFVFIVLAAVFDFLDGLSARLLNAYSALGKELDSLSDMVSFGVAPGCMVYAYLTSYVGTTALPFVSFLLPIFAALRLAKFNLDTRQATSFLGLPVPATGLFWASLIPSMNLLAPSFSIVALVGIVLLIIIFCLLMISEIPMFSLKINSLNWYDNQWPFSLILIAILLLVLFFALKIFLLSVAVIIILYIIMSLIKNRL